ncbi:ATP-binding protein [Candidatus Poriferisodalis sp.]|uniref:ATP-binding protein n=1 Tax=Candidatus Poriferisodalis sp. TaxID=3101277 RepID=UPI003B025384
MSADGGDEGYKLNISRLTIDKLGVRLYDRASAVVAELIANSYDADATQVTVSLPMGTQLDNPDGDGQPWDIVVEDNGHGMDPTEAQLLFLDVGSDRRTRSANGPKSPRFKRPVMGRKGIGKLAPFGICRQIEILSAGGEPVDGKYQVSHFVMDYGEIIKDEPGAAPLTSGEHDRTWREASGTKVTLRQFLPKRVPPADVFLRQLARVFRGTTDFAISVLNLREPLFGAQPLPPFEIEVDEQTRIRLDDRPVPCGDRELPVTGWVAKAKSAYKNDEDAGVRIYARNKIVATTRDFEQSSGYSGEFVVRSYLVGEVVAEWLDVDDHDDLIRTDRQDILWNSEEGEALKLYGQQLVKEVAKSAIPVHEQSMATRVVERSRVESRARSTFNDDELVESAVELTTMLGRSVSEEKLNDSDYLERLVQFVLSVAPHHLLVESFADLAQLASGNSDALDRLVALFRRTEVAALASYAQVARGRIEAISSLEAALERDRSEPVDESRLQAILRSAPWLINPEWEVISENQTLRTFADRYAALIQERWPSALKLPAEDFRRRPDFIMMETSGQLHCIEIKRPHAGLKKEDFTRFYHYITVFASMQEQEAALTGHWARGCVFHLIVDRIDLADNMQADLLRRYIDEGTVVHSTWNDLLAKTRRSNADFLAAREASLQAVGEPGPPDGEGA